MSASTPASPAEEKIKAKRKLDCINSGFAEEKIKAKLKLDCLNSGCAEEKIKAS